LNFAAIDFETANGKRSSACSIGIVEVKGGKVVNKKHLLIKPPILYFQYMVSGQTMSGINLNLTKYGRRLEDILKKTLSLHIMPVLT